MDRVSVLVVGVDGFEKQWQLQALRGRLEAQCRGWNVDLLATVKFARAVELFFNHGDMVLVHLVDNAKIPRLQYAQGSEVLGAAAAERTPCPFINFNAKSLDYLRPIYRGRGIQPSVGTIEGALQRRWQIIDVRPQHTN